MTTIAEARRNLTRCFREAGLESPALDARLIIGHALELDHAALASAAERTLSNEEIDCIDELGARRLRHEPVARIIGEKEFWGMPFVVTPAVLVPRPDSETVVDAALAVLDAAGSRTRPLRIADLGTGSGALLLALLRELPQACGVGTDRDEAALEIAAANAEWLGFAARVGFVACDYGSALAGPLDLVVSNPPYVRTTDVAQLAPEVRDFDPHGALDGGRDGLDAYRAIAADACRLLAPSAPLVLEIGQGQAPDVADLMRAAGLEVEPQARTDLAGIARVVLAWRQP